MSRIIMHRGDIGLELVKQERASHHDLIGCGSSSSAIEDDLDHDDDDGVIAFNSKAIMVSIQIVCYFLCKIYLKVILQIQILLNFLKHDCMNKLLSEIHRINIT